MYRCICVYMYIYIYMERETDDERLTAVRNGTFAFPEQSRLTPAAQV